MSAYALPETVARPELAPKTAYLITSGDLRESANTAGWETQKGVEKGVMAAVADLGWNVVRGFDVDPATGHGFISSQRMGLEHSAPEPTASPASPPTTAPSPDSAAEARGA